MTQIIVDHDSGRVAMSRRHLTALCSADLEDPFRHELERAGALHSAGVTHMLAPIVEVLGSVTTRLVLRRWSGAPAKVTELFLAPSGMVILPDGPDPDVLQEITWHPRPAAVRKLLAEMLDLPPVDSPPLLDATMRPWKDLVGWATDPGSGLRLADLRRSNEPGGSWVSMMVLAWHRDGGIVEVLPTETAGHVTCQPRHPLDVWTGLTTLADRQQAGPVSG